MMPQIRRRIRHKKRIGLAFRLTECGVSGVMITVNNYLNMKRTLLMAVTACLLCLPVRAQDARFQQNLQKAQAGDAAAQFNLGLCYENGNGVAQDMSKAVYWYRKSAEQGDAIGQRNLGVMYYLGIGVDEDKAEALRLMRLSAAQGDETALEFLNVNVF